MAIWKVHSGIRMALRHPARAYSTWSRSSDILAQSVSLFGQFIPTLKPNTVVLKTVAFERRSRWFLRCATGDRGL